jgi:hypothetical protein
MYNILHISFLELYKQSLLTGKYTIDLLLEEDQEVEEDNKEAKDITEEFKLDKFLNSSTQDGKVFYLCQKYQCYSISS